jgi:hypothetical protein
MSSTLQQMVGSHAVLSLSRWLRTDLTLAATLLFLVFASWAMLLTAQSSLHQRQVGPSVDLEAPATDAAQLPPDKSRQGYRRGQILGAFGIVLGLLGCLGLLVICAW